MTDDELRDQLMQTAQRAMHQPCVDHWQRLRERGYGDAITKHGVDAHDTAELVANALLPFILARDDQARYDGAQEAAQAIEGVALFDASLSDGEMADDVDYNEGRKSAFALAVVHARSAVPAPES